MLHKRGRHTQALKINRFFNYLHPFEVYILVHSQWVLVHAICIETWIKANKTHKILQQTLNNTQSTWFLTQIQNGSEIFLGKTKKSFRLKGKKIIIHRAATQTMITGKSLSEALIFESTNPQYDNSSKLGRTCCLQKLFLTFRTFFVQNMFSPFSA